MLLQTPSNTYTNILKMFILELITIPVNTPNLQDHDYAVVRAEVPIEEKLQAAMEEIGRLRQEVKWKNNISQFGLARFMYDDELIQFYTGFSSSNVFKAFIDVIKPSAEKMRTWSQVQRSRAKKPAEGIIDDVVFVNIKNNVLL